MLFLSGSSFGKQYWRHSFGGGGALHVFEVMRALTSCSEVPVYMRCMYTPVAR